MNKRAHKPQYIALITHFVLSKSSSHAHACLFHIPNTSNIPLLQLFFFLFCSSNYKFIYKSDPKLFSSLIIVYMCFFYYIIYTIIPNVYFQRPMNHSILLLLLLLLLYYLSPISLVR